MYEEIDFKKIIAVSNRHVSRLPYLAQVERIVSFHPRAFLLREKDLPEGAYLELAGKVQKICDRNQVPLILHFYPEAAKRLGLPSVHLPLWKFAEAGENSGLKTGVSVHSAEDVRRAEKLGAAYLTAGHIFATDCKRGLAPRGLSFLKEICEQTELPVYGIGGIRLDAEQIRTVLEQGAAGVCIMSQIMRM